MSEINVALEIEKLLAYAKEKALLNKWDVVPARNSLLDLLEIAEPYPKELDYQVPDSPQEILDNLLDYAVDEGILENDSITYRDLFDTRIMAKLMPRQSEVVKQFWRLAKEKSISEATDYFYDLSRDSNYIRKDRIARNMHWLAETDYGELEITINLSKPEKDPKAIAEAKKLAESNYPKCFLCFENVGYAGRLNHPARQSHRVIPITLEGEQWFLQYSPYVYYNEHAIVFYENHSPMKINRATFANLINFVEQIPHYFLGSNADLPLVGGSILAHDHFQGGNHTFPMEKAKVVKEFKAEEFPKVDVAIVDWPMSVVRLNSDDKSQLIDLADKILTVWQDYNDVERKIKAYSKKDGEEIPHNTITPIARKKNGVFELDLVLRNNRCNEQYPSGIFHPHKELHHIKKENIGLIEVMGLAVLPGRLKGELEEIKKFLTGAKEYNIKDLEQELVKHADWIEKLLAKYGNQLSKDKAKQVLEVGVGDKFKQVLEDAGVFKNNKAGVEGFVKFLASVGIK